MGAPAKFLFNDDFARSGAVSLPAAVEARIADAERKGYRNGFAAATAEAEAESRRRTALALDNINLHMAAIGAVMKNIEAKMETEAVDVALAAARQLCTRLMEREPLAEVSALVANCFQQLVAAPHIVIRVNDTLYEGAKPMIEQLARQNGFEGKLVILSEPDIGAGDCRIEWADGGVVRDRAAIEARIVELVDRYIGLRADSAQSAGTN